jgi:ABC-type Fe3+ transport system permease subunit
MNEGEKFSPPYRKEMYKMTIEEYQKKRKWQDRKDRKKWENAFLGFIALMVCVCVGVGLLGLVMSVLG